MQHVHLAGWPVHRLVAIASLLVVLLALVGCTDTSGAEKTAERWLRHLQQGQFAEAHGLLEAKTRSRVTDAELASQWRRMARETGGIKSWKRTRSFAKSSTRGSVVDFTYTLTGTTSIAGAVQLRLVPGDGETWVVAGSTFSTNTKL